MKLYLSSYRIPTPNDLFGLFDKPAGEIKMAVITNAKDKKPQNEKDLKFRQFKGFLNGIGLYPDFIDLRDYQEGTVHDGLKKYDFLWGMGGNTFVLRQEMKRSGFDRVIRTLLDEGVVYGGDSAGAIVAGSSLKGIEIADEPHLADEIIWDGMGLVNTVIVPHADSPAYRVRTPKILALYSPSEVTVLNDNQALVINGNTTRLAQS